MPEQRDRPEPGPQPVSWTRGMVAAMIAEGALAAVLSYALGVSLYLSVIWVLAWALHGSLTGRVSGAVVGAALAGLVLWLTRLAEGKDVAWLGATLLSGAIVGLIVEGAFRARRRRPGG